MAVRWRGNLFGTVVLVAFVASTAAVVGADVSSHQGTLCSSSPDSVAPGEPVELDASSVDASFVEFDKQGNNEYTIFDETDFLVQVTYNETGTYTPQVRADGDSARVFGCGTVTVEASNQPPEAALSVSPRPGTAGQQTTLDASAAADSDGSLVEYRWDFDGDRTVEETTTSATTTHTYSQGSYGPRVTVVDDDGATASTATDYFVEARPPQARCRVSSDRVQVDESVTIDATDSENATEVDYDPDGDDTFERTNQTTFTLDWAYAEPETYSPQVRVRAGDRTDTAFCGNVVVEARNSPPEAALSILPRPGTVGQPATFDASNAIDTDGTIVEYRWDFVGNGTTETTTDSSTTHVYSRSGSYVPQVTVVDDDGATASATADYFVQEPVPEPQARCSVDPTTAVPGENVTIDARESTNAFVVEYDTDGDGTFETERDAFTLTTTYAESGTYAPRVRVVGETGGGTAECGEVVVAEPNEPPEATLSISPRPGTAEQSSTFDASAATDPDGTVVEYRWDFTGNGTAERVTGAAQTTYTYSRSGSYVPQVTVVDDDGATASATADYFVQEPVPEPQAQCSVDPTTAVPGENVTIDARESTNAFAVEYDTDGDGTFETEREAFTLTTTYPEPGTYAPRVRVVGETGGDTAECGEVVVAEPNEPPEAALSISPRPGTAGGQTTLDASSSTDADGSIVEYRWDFDGDRTVEETTTSATTTRAYSQGSYGPRVTVVDDDGATASAATDYLVNEPVPEPQARCTVEPTTVAPDENVTIDARESTNGFVVEYDTDGDGTFETERDAFSLTTTYAEPGTYAPQVRVVGETGTATAECGEVVVEEPGGQQPGPTAGSGGDGQSIPWLPIGAGLAGLVGLGGLGYYLRGSGGGPAGGGGGGGGGGGDTSTPKPKPKPKPNRERPAAYETGVFALPSESGSFAVSVGFEPDVLELRSANGARTDAVVDRTEGWSQGIVVAGETTTQHAMTVADDAHAGDQAVCAVSESAALELIRHEDDGPPGRVTVRVTNTTADGFEVEVSVPGDDPLVGGTRVLFTAIRTGSSADAALGTFETPTEPGTQAVDLPLGADYVSLLASAAVEDTSALWTTDRSTAFSLGHAAAGERIQQVVAGVSAWPGPGHTTGAVCSESAALALLYQDGERIAGETTASATGLGEQLRLQYDRVYSGPHKLGSTARHPVSYLALSSDDTCPAIGQFRLPGPDQTTTVDCGFQPALVELTVVPAAPDERPTETETYPFGWSQGTAIARDGRLAQYVVHHAVAADPVPSVEDTDTAADPTVTGTTATSDGGTPDGLPADISPTGLGDEPTAAEPTAHDDGRAGLWLSRGPDGAVAGRDELRVTALTETGFEATVRSLAAGERDGAPRPTVVYRAWPAVSADDDRTEASTENWQATGHVTGLGDQLATPGGVTDPDDTNTQEDTR